MITNIDQQVDWVRNTKPYITPKSLIDLIRKQYPKDSSASSITSSTPITTFNGNNNGNGIASEDPIVSTSPAPNPFPPSSIPTPELPPPPPPPPPSHLVTNKENIPSSFTFSSSLISSKPPSRQVQSTLPLRIIPANEIRAQRLGLTNQPKPPPPPPPHTSSISEQPTSVITTQYVDLTLSPENPLTSPINRTRKAPPVIPPETPPTQSKRQEKGDMDLISAYQKLLQLQDSKIKILEEKFFTSESTLISIDDKKAIYSTLEKELKSLENNIKATRATIDNGSGNDNTNNTNNTNNGNDNSNDNTSIVENATTTSTILSPIFRTPIAPPRRLAEARQIVANTRNALDVDDEQDDPEDHFGCNELDGLLTPTQYRGRRSDGEIDNGSDLDSFIDDSYQESESESDTFQAKNYDDDTVDELFDIRLSQETAEKMNIHYDSQLPTTIPRFVSPTRKKSSTNSRSIATIVEINSEDDSDREKVDNIENIDDIDDLDDIEEIAFSGAGPNLVDPIDVDYGDDNGGDGDGEDEPEGEGEGDADFEDDDEIIADDYLTQLNQEREINFIELSDDEDNDDDDDEEEEEEEQQLSSRTKMPIIPTCPIKVENCTPTPTPPPPPEQEIIEISDSEGFSDNDDDLVAYFREKRVLPGTEPFIDEVYQVLNDSFKLKSFRANQLEAVAATLQGKDAFVLMPTGGGKSLCYQLPALVKGGKTKGTTVVISPLISLMQDQVQYLTSKGIKAGMISARGAKGDNKHTTNLFREGFLDIVYLSPEKANRSGHTQKIIAKLYKNEQLARVVIDEAHCLSSWGHDFRPDYQGLGFFKEQFPDIPIMALTATANEKVREDILHNLNMEDPVYLKQSFNRTNLFYEIRAKHKDYLQEIKDYILEKHRNQTGIIYCHSKLSCEQTSSKLNEYGLRTSFYHAGMSTEDRYKIQTYWQTNKIQVICATIAFGMGIDKPDVRFVIHVFLPRSLEGYYQETGRAGRDGKPSECIMYYSPRDARTTRTLIQGDEQLSEDAKESHLEKLRQVIQYCENTTDCRRQQVLQYFNENFNPADCNKQCDNCLSLNQGEIIEQDCTEYAKDIIALVKSIQKDKVTVLHCQDVFRGLKHKKIVNFNHHENEYHGKGKSLDRNLVERIFFTLINEGYLTEYIVRMKKSKFGNAYVKVGRNGNLGNKRIMIKINAKQTNNTTGNKKKYAPKEKKTPPSKNQQDKNVSKSTVSPYFNSTQSKSSSTATQSNRGRKRTTSQRTGRSQSSGNKRRKTTTRKSSSQSSASVFTRKATSAMPL